MWKQLLKLLTFALILTRGNCADFPSERENLSGVRIVPVRPTPEPDNVKTYITFPRNGEIYNSSPVKVQARLIGFPAGTYSEFERAKEIYNDPNGQSLLVFVDDYHPIEIYRSFIDSLDRNNLYFDWTLLTSIPYNLGEGMHVIRAFPDRSYGESLKGPGCFAVSVFYIGERLNNLDVDLSGPYLTYNEPLETLTYTEQKPILLDFYLTNTQLSRDGYKIKVTIDGTVDRILTMWVPYYIYGLKQGTHTIQLQLLNGRNQVVPGIFNDVTRTITVGN